MFKGGEVLMSEDIGLFSVTLFSLNWSLEIGQYVRSVWSCGFIYNLFIFDNFFNSFLDEVKMAFVE